MELGLLYYFPRDLLFICISLDWCDFRLIFRASPPLRLNLKSTPVVYPTCYSFYHITLYLSSLFYQKYSNFTIKLPLSILYSVSIHQIPYHSLILGMIALCLVFKEHNARFIQRYSNFRCFFRNSQFRWRWQKVFNLS